MASPQAQDDGHATEMAEDFYGTTKTSYGTTYGRVQGWESVYVLGDLTHLTEKAIKQPVQYELATNTINNNSTVLINKLKRIIN